MNTELAMTYQRSAEAWALAYANGTAKKYQSEWAAARAKAAWQALSALWD